MKSDYVDYKVGDIVELKNGDQVKLIIGEDNFDIFVGRLFTREIKSELYQELEEKFDELLSIKNLSKYNKDIITQARNQIYSQFKNVKNSYFVTEGEYIVTKVKETEDFDHLNVPYGTTTRVELLRYKDGEVCSYENKIYFENNANYVKSFFPRIKNHLDLEITYKVYQK